MVGLKCQMENINKCFFLLLAQGLGGSQNPAACRMASITAMIKML